MGIKKMNQQGITAQIVAQAVYADTPKNQQEQPEEPGFAMAISVIGFLRCQGFRVGLDCIKAHWGWVTVS